MTKMIILPDQHAHPDYNNDRADWAAQLIIDQQPDIVVNLGDAADMPSLSSYDKGKRSFQGRNYKDDLNAHLDFQERLWGPVKARKKKLPYRVVLEGNHEHRIERALDLSPELVGTYGFGDYDFGSYYNEVVRYEGGTPGIIEIENILFAHYFIAGVSGRAVSGENPAHMLLDKVGQSAVCGHIHTFDFTSKANIQGVVRNTLVAGCYQDYINPWAGNIGQLWRPGIAILHNVENGNYDLQWVSLKSLKSEYGK